MSTLQMNNRNVGAYIFGIILTYMPFHFFEEALGNWPLWMKTHHYTPVLIPYGQWMAVNVFLYYPLLLLGVALYRLKEDRFFFAGVAVLLWGLMDALEHMVYTLIDLRWTPGLLTGCVLGMISMMGLRKMHALNAISTKIVLPSVLTAIVFAGLPVAVQIYFGAYFRMVFGR